MHRTSSFSLTLTCSVRIRLFSPQSSSSRPPMKTLSKDSPSLRNSAANYSFCRSETTTTGLSCRHITFRASSTSRRAATCNVSMTASSERPTASQPSKKLTLPAYYPTAKAVIRRSNLNRSRTYCRKILQTR